MLISSHFTTNNYHLFRAGLFARMAGLKADGIGAKPLLFLPNAFIREFIAIVVMYKRRHIIVCVPSCHRYGYVILNRIDYSVKKEFPYEFVSKIYSK